MADIKHQKTFKISDLDEIETTRIDNKDSFIITDYYNNQHITKRISIKKLIDFFARNPQLIDMIIADETFDQSVQTKVDDKVKDISLINGGNAHTVN